MLLRALGKLALVGGKAGMKVGSSAAIAGGGFAFGAGMGAVGAAAGVGYLGYRAIRAGSPMLHPWKGEGIPQLGYRLQSKMIGGVLGTGAAAGMLTRDPGYRADFSPGGNLEVKGPAMLEATGDLALSLNRNARRVPSPTQYGYMMNTTISGNGRY